MRSVLVALTAMSLAAVTGTPAVGQTGSPTGPARSLPDWASPPDAEAVASHYPNRANRLQVEGSATISCFLDPSGKLYDCHTVEENPKGFGFGDAAVAMAAEFRMKPETIDGRPVGTDDVRIPISFRLPQTPEPRWRWPWQKPETAANATDSEAGKQKPDPDPSILARPWILIGLGLAILAAVGALIAFVSGAGRSRLPDL